MVRFNGYVVCGAASNAYISKERAALAGQVPTMSYVKQVLASDEEIIHRANFNWTYSFFPVLWFVIGILPVVMFIYIQFGAGVAFEELRLGWWMAGASAFLGSWILTGHLIHLMTTEIVVTTYRFVYKRGLVSRDTQEVSLNKIEEISLTQSVWGRVFGYGQLVLRGTGVGVIELPNLDNPIDVRKIIENAKADLRRSSFDERTGDAD
ncbi:MAG: PH domain-containing protein [Pseudomonadota bacterium]